MKVAAACQEQLKVADKTYLLTKALQKNVMSTNTRRQNRARDEEPENTTRNYTADVNKQLKPASFSDILCICFKAVGLLLIAFICFVTLIHRNHLKVTLDSNRDFNFTGKILDPKTQYRRRNFYTNVQQSKLLMYAGIMGFCAISFSSFFMQLMCFWIAKMWFKQSERVDRAVRLPTPLQMAVIFQIADGGWGGFWGYLTYAKEGKYIGQVTRVVRKMNHKRAVTKQPIPIWAIHWPAWLLLVVLLTG
ncbi:hypothetical protein L211DRAFT_643707 [Terfezia boudieri ATCC MYA-4762]|uniref:Uncharacterized protein n=1 Tax=Terfezia boudieri ATCC MYA-4762 TaxID=1051890 RepID=A0A3N4LEV7_9PEZI|nr:hypothetical protein L211DRAFT_643707 [Terfezia boudieri ATCC MYA-4762]